MSAPKASMSETGQVTASQTDTDDMKSWEATESYMMKHDVGMVKDFADDVDTLLVFAGLFSAVLTSFVVESYHLLQADNTENAVKLLARISSQLESFTFTQGFLNSTIPALPPAPKFAPDNKSLWINALWFLGLLFSLSAALFGILVKQWLREYLRWNSALSSPRENVLVRQARFEAWNEWNMSSTISCIPALLEVALIFFVCGLVILLWTLDPIVACVITAAASVFMLIVSSFTLLPVFFKRCPYKSPTAWACVLLWELVKDIATRAATIYKLGFALEAAHAAQLRWTLQQSRTRFSNWRARDIASTCISHFPDWRGKKHDAVAVIRNEIAAEWHNLSEDGELQGEVAVHQVSFDAAYEALRPISQAPVLFRALSWVSQASQESHIQQQVLRCTESLHRPLVMLDVPWYDALGTHGVRNLSVWQLLFICRDTSSEVHNTPPGGTDHLRLVSTLRKSTRTLYDAIPMVAEKRQVMRYEADGRGIQHCKWLFSQYSPCDAQIMSHILAGCLRATVEELLGEWDIELRGAFFVHGRRATELLSVLQGLLYHTYPNVSPTCVTILIETYNKICASPRKDSFDSSFPGLRCIILEAACRIGIIDMNEDGRLVVHSIAFWRMSASHFATLAIKLCPQQHDGPCCADQHVFVTMVDECLWRMKHHDEPLSPSLGYALLDAMCAVTDACSDADVPNCGCYADLPWLENMCCPTPTHNLLASTLPDRYRDLILALEKASQCGLITGVGVKTRLHELLGAHSGFKVAPLRWKPRTTTIPLDDPIVTDLPNDSRQATPSPTNSFRAPPPRSSSARGPLSMSTTSHSGWGNLLRSVTAKHTRDKSVISTHSIPATPTTPSPLRSCISLTTFGLDPQPHGTESEGEENLAVDE